MNLSDPTKKLEILLKAENHVMRFQKARLIRGIIGGFFIYIFLIFAYVMLNVAGFFYFFEDFSGWVSALIVSGINFALGLIVFIALRFQRQSAQEQMALDLRKIARRQVCNDVQQVVDEVKSIEASIKSIRDLLKGPAAIAGIIGMLLTMFAPLMKTVQKKKDK